MITTSYFVVFFVLLLILWSLHCHKRRQRWLMAYATYMSTKVSDMPWSICLMYADASLDNLNGDTSEDPVQAADDDMAEWSE